MDKSIYLGFAMLELGKLHMYETYYDKLQLCFGQENLQLHYMDCDSFVLSINTQKTIKAKNEFKKDFYKLLNNQFHGKTLENVRNRLRLEFFKKDDIKNIIKQQSKLTFNGIHKSYEICDSCLFE